MGSESLSEKRRRAGRLGAAARWGHGRSGGKPGTDAIRDSKPWFKTTRPVAKLRAGRNDWYRIENRAADVAQVYLFDEIGWFGVTAADFVDDLREVTAGRIELHINSPGGDVFDGVAIYNALLDHAAAVDVVVDSLAASAASFIAQAGDTVAMNRGAQMMIHDAWGLSIGNASDMRELADLLDRQSDNIAAIYADRAGGTVAQWRDLMRDETWFNADEAVDAGLADEVRGRAAQSDNSFDLSVFTHAGRAKAPAPVIPAPSNEHNDDLDINVEEITAALEEAFR